MRVWVTRAQPGADRTADRLIALGHMPQVVPLLAIQPLNAAIDLVGIQALAFTSINGVTAFADLCADRSLLVLTVGDATARAAQDAGFTDIRSADGDLAALAVLIRAQAPGLSILHPGAAEPAGDLAALVGDVASVRSVPVYGSKETHAAPPDAWDAVLVHSPRAARALSASSVPAGRIAAAISPAAAAPLAELGFSEIRIATAPTEAALLATLGKPETSV